MRYFSTVLLCLSVVLTLAGGCQESKRSSLQVSNNNSNAGNCRPIDHGFGQTEICGTPERIVALDTHALDLLLSLGLEPIGYAEDQRALVGQPGTGQSIVDVKYLGDRLTTQPIHIGTSQSPSLEAILGLSPDLILGSFVGNSEYQTLSKIAPTLVPGNLGEPDGWRETIQMLGQILEREDQASAVLAAHDQQISRAKANLSAYQGQSILLLSMSGLDYISIFTNETFAGRLLEDMGFTLLVPSYLRVTNGEIVISSEILPQLEPDLIIVMASGDSQVTQIQQIWQDTPLLRSLPTYQTNRVHFVDYQLWSRITGPIAAELILEEVQTLLD